jgi:hypothetical protein
MAVAGHMWVENTLLCITDSAGAKKCTEGSVQAGTGSPGYMWIQGVYIFYTDNVGQVRRIDHITAQTDLSPPLANGTKISQMWLQGGAIRYIGNDNRVREWYMGHANGHNDVAPHGNSHSNSGYASRHGNVHGNHSNQGVQYAPGPVHANAHSNGHANRGYTAHGNTKPHGNSHGDRSNPPLSP